MAASGAGTGPSSTAIIVHSSADEKRKRARRRLKLIDEEAEADLMAPNNQCGMTLLQLVSQASSIIAEISRLADAIPSPFLAQFASRPEDRVQVQKFQEILFDFRYFQEPDMYDTKVSRNPAFSDLDDECNESHGPLLERFYLLFEAVHRWIDEFKEYLDNLDRGFYISHTTEGVFLHADGKQLLCEAFFMMCVMLILLDRRVPGPVRERIVVAHYRLKGEGSVTSIEDVMLLCRDTGYRPGAQKRPPEYPEAYFARFDMPKPIIAKLMGRLRSDDVYQLQRAYPLPEHQSFALAQQAGMVWACLYLAPRTLHSEVPTMRALVDRFFADNWVIPVYMGLTIDLTIEWAAYPAAVAALKGADLGPKRALALARLHHGEALAGSAELDGLLAEGELSEATVAAKLPVIMTTLRKCNTSLRWFLLHRNTASAGLRDVVRKSSPTAPQLLDFLLRTASLEFRLKGLMRQLLDSRQERWAAGQARCEDMLNDLSLHFSGTSGLRRVEEDEELQEHFSEQAARVAALNFDDPTLAGRKIQRLIRGLTDVEEMEAVETSTTCMEYLRVIRAELEQLIRLLNVKEHQMQHLMVVADLAYAWGVMGEFIPLMHRRIQKDPGAVDKLRATFLKLASVLDVPLVRVTESDSPDAPSVAQHYSTKLVVFLRKVMDIVPITVFEKLRRVVALQTEHMKVLPARLELDDLPKVAQPRLRYNLALLTHEISVFTQGVLAQEETLLGIIRVKPRRILNDGVRKQLVIHVCKALDAALLPLAIPVGPPLGPDGKPIKSKRGASSGAGEADPVPPAPPLMECLAQAKQRLDGLRSSFEYIQDFIGIKGLHLWQQEFARIMSYYAEQEANRYLRKKVAPRDSRFQSEAVPIPFLVSRAVAPAADPKKGAAAGAGSPRGPVGGTNFLGRVVTTLMDMTRYDRTTFSPNHAGWFLRDGTERAGLRAFASLREGLGVAGVAAVDRVVAFRVARVLSMAVQTYAGDGSLAMRGAVPARGRAMLRQVAKELEPLSKLVPAGHSAFDQLGGELGGWLQPMRQYLLEVGQLQLVRRRLAHELRFAARLDSKLLHGSLSALSGAVISDVRQHYHRSEEKPYPDPSSPLLPELSRHLQASGLADPCEKIYLLVEPQPLFPLFLAVLTIREAPALRHDPDFGSLAAQSPAGGTDGYAMAVGLATVLRQLHPRNTSKFLGYLGQHLRSITHASLTGRNPGQLPDEVGVLAMLLVHICEVLALPSEVLHCFVPKFVLDGVVVG